MQSAGLGRYRKDVFSQNGEDGVIEELFNRLGILTGWCCEFGAWDGKHLSNTYNLMQRGWNSVLIEGEPTRFADLQRNFGAQQGNTAWLLNEFVAATGDRSLDRLLARTPIPADFELLSIDIDGDDYHVWDGLDAYRPKAVVIEIDSSIPPGREQVPSRVRPGASFSSTLRVAARKGYKFVCHTGNLIFVRGDLAPAGMFPEVEQRPPAELFDDAWLSKPQKLRHRLKARLHRYH
jgi:hypothetical protein